MKKIIALVLFGLTTIQIEAQNIQTHYDFGADRQMITTTVENFALDDYGNTFFFIDFNFGGKAANVEGVSSAYFEIARSLNFWDNPFALQIELNSGMFRTATFSAPINRSILLGGNYTFFSSNPNKMLKLALLYKSIKSKTDASYQITAAWQLKSENEKFIFKGFTDFWKEENSFSNTQTVTDFVFLSEPQLWYVLSPQLQIGGEIELSSNFSGNKGFMANPTLAAKWIF